MKRARHQQGSVVFNRRSRTWHFLWREEGKRRSKRIGSERDYPTKAAAWKAAKPLRTPADSPVNDAPMVKALVERYESERIPSRFSTARMYRSWLRNHILPRWGDRPIKELQPRPVELWLRHLDLSPKSKSHIRTMLRILFDYGMWCGALDVSRNPMELVVVKGATKRTRQPRSLTVEEFQKLVERLAEPFRTMALVMVCFGLRVSELLALKWSDLDWLNGKLHIERAIVMQNVDEVKTVASQKQMTVDRELLGVFKAWKQTTLFPAEHDWMFASPVKLGRLPLSYPWFFKELQRAATAAGIGAIGTHTFRHTYRSWLDAVGTPIAVQQKLMRHTDIRTTLNIYGDVVTDEMAQASSKVAGLALKRHARA